MSRPLAVCTKDSIMHSPTCVQHTEERSRKHEQRFRNESSLRIVPTVETNLCRRCGSRIAPGKSCCVGNRKKFIETHPVREELLQHFVGLSRRICWKWRATCQCVVDDVWKNLQNGTLAKKCVLPIMMNDGEASPEKREIPTIIDINVEMPRMLEDELEEWLEEVGSALQCWKELPRARNASKIHIQKIRGVRTPHGGPALSMLAQADAPCAVSIAGVATADVLRAPYPKLSEGACSCACSPSVPLDRWGPKLSGPSHAIAFAIPTLWGQPLRQAKGWRSKLPAEGRWIKMDALVPSCSHKKTYMELPFRWCVDDLYHKNTPTAPQSPMVRILGAEWPLLAVGPR